MKEIYQVELPRKIIMGGKILETVDKFKYLGVTLTKNGKSESEINIRITTTSSALVRLKTIWKSIKSPSRPNSSYINH